MKRTISMTLAILLIAALLPTAALAAPDFEATYFPGGGITTPTAPYLVYEPGEVYSDMIRMWYSPSGELRTLDAAMSRWYASDETFERFFGVYDFETVLQIDAKIDNGPWQYTTAWDDPEWNGLEDIYDLTFRTFGYPYADAQFREIMLSDLHHLGNDSYGRGFLAPAVYTEKDDYGETIYRYDLSEHTMSVRYRFGVRISPEYGTNMMAFSDWSPVTSIGKNGNQKKLTAPTALAAPVLSELRVEVNEDGGRDGRYYIDIPDSVYDAMLYCEADRFAFQPMYLQAQMRVNGGAWEDVYTANPCDLWDGFRSAAPAYTDLKESDKVEVRARIESDFLGMVSPWSNVVSTKTAYQASDWAQNWIAQADTLGLIPDCLVGQDLTRQITRQEFAAVAVKIYEAISGKKAVPVTVNPFTDCSDPEVLKALNLGITDGTDVDKFSPNVVLTREQLATMLTRVYKKVMFAGWTLDTDSSFDAQFKAMFVMPERFADDAQISAYARDSVYFMKARGIIDGVGDNLFAPNHGQSAAVAAGYGYATREQALKIAVGMTVAN